MDASPLWVLSFTEEGDKADVAITLTPGRAQCIFIVLPAAPGDVSLLVARGVPVAQPQGSAVHTYGVPRPCDGVARTCPPCI